MHLSRFQSSSRASVLAWMVAAALPSLLLSTTVLAQAQQGTQLPAVVVQPPSPATDPSPTAPATQGAAPAKRPAPATRQSGAPAPAQASAGTSTPVQTPVDGSAAGGPAANTPLNGNVVTEVGTRLGLTARETPASIDVIDRQTIQDRGLRTTTDVAQGAVGVTAGDAPGAAAAFSMRGFTGTQINTLYNGIKIGPSEMTGRIMDTFNLDRVEILKGPASLLSGEGAIGGTVNYVTKAPHTGAVRSEAFTAYDSFHGYRAGYGSGGSTLVDGLDYRFDISRAANKGFIDDTYSRLGNVSGQLDYRLTGNFKVWGAFEYKQDRNRYYWGTPLVPANAPGIVPTKGIVSGLWTNYWLNGHSGDLNPVTIDARTLKTNYNVLDNHSGANERWLRGGYQWNITDSIQLRTQVYGYDAQRHWYNNEANAYDDSPGVGQVYRERLSVDHDQSLFGHVTDLTVSSTILGMENRFVTTVAASRLQFNVVQDDFFNNDYVSLINPIRGYYGPQQTKTFFTHVDNRSLAFEDRLKIVPTFAVIGGIRMEQIDLERTAYDVDNVLRSAAGYPYAKTFNPTTGRAGYVWEALPGVSFFSQYATGADPAVANIFNLRPTQPLVLTTARTYETGVKLVSPDKTAEFTASAFDIERKNVYVPESGIQFNLAGRIESRGYEIAGAVKPMAGVKIWGNAAVVRSRFADFSYTDSNGLVQSYSGNTPPNVPSLVANAGASYLFATTWPLEVGASTRYVGDRFNFQDNLVVMNAYTLLDAYAYLELPKAFFSGIEQARLTFRGRNLTNKLYAQWGDPGYTDQVMLGMPRSYEMALSLKW